MKIAGLENHVMKAQQDLQIAQLKAAELQKQAKAAKAKARQAKLKYRTERKFAKKVKKLLLAAEEQLQEQRRVLIKARKCLAKGYQKLVAVKAIPGRKLAAMPGIPRVGATVRGTPPRPVARAKAIKPPKPHSPSFQRQPLPTVAQSPPLPPASPVA